MPTRTHRPKPGAKELLPEPTLPVDADSPWKELIEHFFPEFMEFFHPSAHQDIDWTQPTEFLQQELAQITIDAKKGRRYADKLAKVFQKGGEEIWVLIHIEVQGQKDPEFASRMATYRRRIQERHGRPVASIAILADEDPKFHPTHHEQSLWGCRDLTTFHTVKLLDDKGQIETLLHDPNPFGMAVVAHLRAQSTRRQAGARFRFKRELILLLYERDYERAQIQTLFRALDWLLRLPAPLETRLKEAIEATEEAKRMPYVTSWEEMGFERGKTEGLAAGKAEGLAAGKAEGLAAGKAEGLVQGALLLLRQRLGTVPNELSACIAGLQLTQIERLYAELAQMESVEDLEAWLSAQEDKTLQRKP